MLEADSGPGTVVVMPPTVQHQTNGHAEKSAVNLSDPKLYTVATSAIGTASLTVTLTPHSHTAIHSRHINDSRTKNESYPVPGSGATHGQPMDKHLES